MFGRCTAYRAPRTAHRAPRTAHCAPRTAHNAQTHRPLPEPSLSPDPATVFLWDFDGTLADTRLRNYRITCRLFGEATGRDIEQFPALASFEVFERTQRRYLNWRLMLALEFGFTEDETDRLGGLWHRYQMADTSPVAIIDGLDGVIRALSRARHGVVSQNARAQIVRTLEAAGLAPLFGAVIGYDSVGMGGQKPAPDGGLAALETLGPPVPTRIVGIGDHETDVRCARNLAAALVERGAACEVVAIAARFVDGVDPARWDAQPDYVAGSPAELLDAVRDWLIE
jgi:phosphoglycolate phosphatase-like HAD superfamily hydrolase